MTPDQLREDVRRVREAIGNASAAGWVTTHRGSLDRLADAAEELARVREGIKKLSETLDNQSSADRPDTEYDAAFCDGESSVSAIVLEKLAALLGEGESGGTK